MKIRKDVLNALIISLSLHGLFFAYASGAKMPGIQTAVERSKRIFNIRNLRLQGLEARPIKRRGITYTNVLKFKNPVLSDRALTSFSERKQLEKDEFGRKKEERISKPMELKQAEDESLLPKEKFKVLDRAEDITRITRKSLVEVDNLSDEGIIVPKDVDELFDLPEEFFQKMPGFTPKAVGGIVDSLKRKFLSGSGAQGITTIERKGKYSDIGQYLVCNLSTYQDPRDGQKYFEIAILAGADANKLDSMKKEIVFVVDCSLSIKKARLEEFKRGLEYCLKHLNKDDRFNILAFKEKNIWLRASSVSPDNENIREALDFVQNLTAGEGTDAYRALYESIRVAEAMLPSYIIFLSDGRPTHGITNSMRIINEITRFNSGARPIFAFSGGSRVNRYFLDFISYKNRGWTEYADRTYSIAKYLGGMYNKIKDPLLLNLRYYASGINSREVFPKALPDFFRNAEFTLFGKYDSEDEFSLQLLGDSDEETNEFVIVGSLNDARQGSEDIAKNWAFNKIYYLIGLLEYDKENQKIINEINELCAKFDIITPYSDLIKK